MTADSTLRLKWWRKPEGSRARASGAALATPPLSAQPRRSRPGAPKARGSLRGGADGVSQQHFALVAGRDARPLSGLVFLAHLRGLASSTFTQVCAPAGIAGGMNRPSSATLTGRPQRALTARQDSARGKRTSVSRTFSLLGRPAAGARGGDPDRCPCTQQNGKPVGNPPRAAHRRSRPADTHHPFGQPHPGTETGRGAPSYSEPAGPCRAEPAGRDVGSGLE